MNIKQNSEDKKRTLYSIARLFQEDASYFIPMYQRNYSWGEPEIEQLIQDIEDGCKNNNGQNYYLGTLVVNQRRNSSLDSDTKFEIIDGQQRFTTLLLLLFYLERKKLLKIGSKKIEIRAQLDFECREKSTSTLERIRVNGIANLAEDDSATLTILDGYAELEEQLKPILDKEGFVNYLLDKVKILRLIVPYGTDVNHYFEVMNNRGEQLEKHEVLKARLMDKVKDDKDAKLAQYTINRIWEACMDMNRYVQMGFNVDERTEIFGGNWESLQKKDFGGVVDGIRASFEGNSQNLNETKDISLDDILDGEKAQGDDKNLDKQNDNTRFESIIDFPNFLLHALRSYQRSVLKQTKDLVSSTDKKLLEDFNSVILETDDAANKVKEFTFHLLRCRYLFDRYVIKRESLHDREGWAIKKLGKRKKENQNDYWNTFSKKISQDEEEADKSILMLQAALYVSYTSPTFKHWLAVALDYLVENQGEINADEFSNYLKNMVHAILAEILLFSSGKEYKDILLYDFSKKKIYQLDLEQIVEKLKYKNKPHHLIFNYLDFLLWQEKRPGYSGFRFVRGKSIEHFEPQSSKNPEVQKVLDNFGNLFLVTSSQNSSVSARGDRDKKARFENMPNTSMKLRTAINLKDFQWNLYAINTHEEEMLKLLINDIQMK